jgi:hypothetical protein
MSIVDTAQGFGVAEALRRRARVPVLSLFGVVELRYDRKRRSINSQFQMVFTHLLVAPCTGVTMLLPREPRGDRPQSPANAVATKGVSVITAGRRRERIRVHWVGGDQDHHHHRHEDERDHGIHAVVKEHPLRVNDVLRASGRAPVASLAQIASAGAGS